MVAFGLLLSTVGKDPIYGAERFTFHIFSLFDGLNIALLAMGVFGVAELLIMAEGGSAAVRPVVQPKRLIELLPNRADWRASALPILRGTGLGFFLGLLPGGGATLSSFSSYVLEGGWRKRRSVSVTARSKAWPGRNPPTTRRRSRRSCPC
jgi:Uncharacterized protein conserved in bacteria